MTEYLSNFVRRKSKLSVHILIPLADTKWLKRRKTLGQLAYIKKLTQDILIPR
jgi:hypothetical protein